MIDINFYLQNIEFKQNQIDEILSKPKTITVDNIFEAYCWIGNDYDFYFFEYINKRYKLSVEAYSEALKEAYTRGRILRKAKKYFNNKKYNWVSVANEEEKTIYNSLPERITIYRGTSIKEARGSKYNLGLSWTFDRGTAEFFAFRYGLPDRAVIEVDISKDEIKAFFNERNEKEIICIFPKGNIKITTLEATSYLEQYCKKRNEEENNF